MRISSQRHVGVLSFLLVFCLTGHGSQWRNAVASGPGIVDWRLPIANRQVSAGTRNRQSEINNWQSAQRSVLTPADHAFLEDLERRSFQYFWEQGDPNTGLVADRSRSDASPPDENHRNVGSIAATGFGLTALCIAAERGWIDQTKARERTRNTLRFFADRVYQQHGWFYHWLDTKTGERRWSSEVSSIDTALLLGGVLTSRQYFRDDPEIRRLATK